MNLVAFKIEGEPPARELGFESAACHVRDVSRNPQSLLRRGRNARSRVQTGQLGVWSVPRRVRITLIPFQRRRGTVETRLIASCLFQKIQRVQRLAQRGQTSSFRRPMPGDPVFGKPPPSNYY